MDLKGVEIFRVGRWNDLRTFTEDDLQAMEDSFAELRLAGRTPLKLGHNDEQPLTDGQPALGWVQRVWRDGEVLKADFGGMPRAVHEAVRAGLYKHVSVELLRDVMAGNKEWPWVLSAVALLGADIPAVAGLRDLQALTHSRRAQFASGTRMTFTINNGGRDEMEDVQKLQAEVRKLNGKLVRNLFDDAIKAHRILPRDRHGFETRFGADATIEQAEKWIAETPRPELFSRDQRPGRGAHDSRADTMQEGDAPDSEVRALTFAEMEKSGEKDYFIAQRKVMQANPDLANRYRHMPGTRE